MKWSVKRAANSGESEFPPAPVILGGLSLDPEQSEAHRRSLDLKVSIHRALLDKINLSALEKLARETIRKDVAEIIGELLTERHEALNRAEREALVDDVLDELLGLGPLEPLLQDDSVTDILVNGPKTVFIERNGVLERVKTEFQDERHLMRIIQKIVSAVGRRIDESSPFVDARLADGSRVNAIVAPLAVDGSLLSIRKFAKKRIGIDRLIELGSVPEPMAEVMRAVVRSRSSRSRTAPSCSCSRNTSPVSRRGPRTSRAGARSPSAISSRTRCACDPTGLLLGKFAPAKPSTCSRP